MTGLFASLRRLRRDRRGVSVIEFAFVAPVLALFVIGIIDAGRAFSAKLTLDQTVYRALEKVVVGTNDTDYTAILTAEVQNTSGYSATDAITVDQWLECDLNGVHLDYNTGSCTAGQQSSRYVQLKVDRQFAPSFGYGKWFLGANANGKITLSSTWTVRMQ